jgi:hypothetical protein
MEDAQEPGVAPQSAVLSPPVSPGHCVLMVDWWDLGMRLEGFVLWSDGARVDLMPWRAAEVATVGLAEFVAATLGVAVNPWPILPLPDTDARSAVERRVEIGDGMAVWRLTVTRSRQRGIEVAVRPESPLETAASRAIGAPVWTAERRR